MCKAVSLVQSSPQVFVRTNAVAMFFCYLQTPSPNRRFAVALAAALLEPRDTSEGAQQTFLCVFVYIPVPTRAGSCVVHRVSVPVLLIEFWPEDLEAESSPPQSL
jgi:hypothetical protein